MENGIELPGAGPALLFAAAALASVVGGVVVSGYFPRHARQSTMIGAASEIAVVVLALASLLAAVSAVLLAAETLPWYAAVILGGLAIVAGPLVEQRLPVGLRVSVTGIAALTLMEGAVAAVSLHRAGLLF